MYTTGHRDDVRLILKVLEPRKPSYRRVGFADSHLRRPTLGETANLDRELRLFLTSFYLV